MYEALDANNKSVFKAIFDDNDIMQNKNTL